MKYNGDDNKSGFWEQEKSRLEDKLVNKIFKCLIRFLIEVIVMTVLIVGINIFMNGMYLWGLPRINDIQSVNITYPSVTDGRSSRTAIWKPMTAQSVWTCVLMPDRGLILSLLSMRELLSGRWKSGVSRRTSAT